MRILWRTLTVSGVPNGDAGRVDRDQYLAGPGLGDRELMDRKNFGTSALIDGGGEHRCGDLARGRGRWRKTN
jgi:hypothetical protein